ncbi:hypothetical protein F511_14387 [Dorcoceras hygrometricum]|uniref:Ribosomal protein L34Ae n=1 Tax=Dorcoceras hygrometricum TaxID=472368 RepID=A0A2Z7A424_9LAMI|nr:hypothetical protein F511_14387 [Dorcoceras hygrometricum]
MLQCHTETIARLFYNVSSSFLLLLIFFHFTSIFLAKVFILSGGNPFYQRNREGYVFNSFSDEEMEEGDEYSCHKPMEGEKHAANLCYGDHEGCIGKSNDELGRQSLDSSVATCYDTPDDVESGDEEAVVDEDHVVIDSDSCCDSEEIENDPTSNHGSNLQRNETYTRDEIEYGKKNRQTKELNFSQGENFLVFQPSKAEGKKLMQENDEGEIFGDTFTVGSTSKDSSEWRSSINCRDSCTDDPFSSSSRRSCPKWESYTLFQKYDEEMLFLDRISAQKLQETESLRSIQACPRSISERIVHKLGTRNKKSSRYRHNPYQELEAAYVAQICLTWEALNWNYKYFQRLRPSLREHDLGCPAYIAQQFQQFQVMLQRYVENEPYEHGRRPEIYARIRSLAPKLLQVPEYRGRILCLSNEQATIYVNLLLTHLVVCIDSDQDDRREAESNGSRIPSDSFLNIMKESVRTFMSFMKQDRRSHCEILAEFFSRKRSGSADATLLHLLKRVNKKKKAKLNNLRRPGKCFRKRRLREDEELEILMALIDLKVVSRVLRMADLSGEQLNWCENKMSKVRVSDRKLQRDSSPLFFPAH